MLAELAGERVLPTRAAARDVLELSPEAVARSVVERLERLPPVAGRLARAVAILGANAELRHAAALAELDGGEAAEAADALEAAGIANGRPLEFVHPIIRNAVYEDLPSARRGELHARAARLLGAESINAAAAATQLLAAEPAGDQRAVELLRRAGAEALADGAPSAASSYLRRALAEPPQPPARVQVLWELGAAEFVAREPGAANHLEQARSLARDPSTRAQLALALVDGLVFAGRSDEAKGVSHEAMEELGDENAELALRLQTQNVQIWWGGTKPVLDASLERLRLLARSDAPSARPLRVFLAQRAAMLGDSPDEVITVVRSALDGGRMIADETSDAMAAVQAVGALIFVDELDEAEGVLADMQADARRRGSVVGFVATSAWRAFVALRRGAIESAEADARAALALALAEEHEVRYAAPFIASFLAGALLEQGRIEETASILESVRIEQLRGAVRAALVLDARGRLRLAQGRPREAAEDLRAAGRLCQKMGITSPMVVAWRSSLAGAVAESDPRAALELVETELALAQPAGLPRGIGVARRARGLLVGGAEGIEQLGEAVATLERSPSRLEHARALTDLGAALRRSNRRSEAREPLRGALELAHACGATALSVRARDELVASGARPRRIERSGADALTASEQRVAAMAVEGLSNPQIAQALFVSRKTVEMHLGNAYRKLEIGSRGELSDALGQSRAVA